MINISKLLSFQHASSIKIDQCNILRSFSSKSSKSGVYLTLILTVSFSLALCTVRSLEHFLRPFSACKDNACLYLSKIIL